MVSNNILGAFYLRHLPPFLASYPEARQKNEEVQLPTRNLHIQIRIHMGDSMICGTDIIKQTVRTKYHI